jgi:hypothetical protein
MSTGVVAQGKILHAGITQARSIVRNKAGKKVEFGLGCLKVRSRAHFSCLGFGPR